MKDNALNGSVRLIFCYFGGSRSADISIRNFRVLREEYLPQDIEVMEVDIVSNPDVAEQFNVIATPMLIKLGAGRPIRIIGDLSDPRRVLENLNITASKLI